jgi:hypothetical protein
MTIETAADLLARIKPMIEERFRAAYEKGLKDAARSIMANAEKAIKSAESISAEALLLPKSYTEQPRARLEQRSSQRSRIKGGATLAAIIHQVG